METLAATLLCLLFLSRSAISDSEQDTDDAEMEVCSMADYDLDNNMNNFKNIDAVIEFKKHLEKGLLGQNEHFNIRDPDIRAETISIVDLICNTKDLKTHHKIINWLFNKANMEQVSYAVAIANLRKTEFGWKEEVSVLDWIHMCPYYFVPQSIINKVRESVEQGTYNKSNVHLIVPDESDPTAYFREDPDLSKMYYNWNLLFPHWLDPKKYANSDWSTRGDLIYEFHNQLVVAYYLRSNTKRPEWRSQWNGVIKEGYKTELANELHRPFSSRAPNHPQDTNEHYRKLMEVVDNLLAMNRTKTIYVNESYSIPITSNNFSTMTTIMSNLVYQTADSVSPSHYGSLFEACINYLSSVGSDPSKDIGGLSGHPLTALRDPAYYEVLAYVNGVVEAFKTDYSNQYTEKEFKDEDLTLHSIESSRMETFFEPIDLELGYMIPENTHPPGLYIVRQLRLNHRPVTLKFNVSSTAENTKPALITVLLLNDLYSGDSELIQPIDSFKAVVNPGENVIERNLSDTYIFPDTREDLDAWFMVPCGIPLRLMLPKGTEEGLKMSLLAVITPYVGEEEEESEPTIPVKSPLCGNYLANHGRSFGFPVDRGLPDSITRQQFALYNATIYHTRNTFQGGIIM